MGGTCDTCWGGEGNAYWILVGKAEGKSSLDKPEHGGKKMNVVLKEVAWEGVD
jgi:hypothetical protein